jgi:hypothetical protein
MPVASEHSQFVACWYGLDAGRAYRLRVKLCGAEPPGVSVAFDEGDLNGQLVELLADGETMCPDGVILEGVGVLTTTIEITASTEPVVFELDLLSGNDGTFGKTYTANIDKQYKVTIQLRLEA